MYPQKKRRSKKAIYKAQIRKKLIRVVLGLCILSLASVGVLRLAVPNVFSAINKQLNYQGKLRNSAGITVSDGAYNMRFSIYNAASGGTRLWTECGTTGTPTSRTVTVVNGVFSVMLGDTASGACPGGTNSNEINLEFNIDNYYLGLTVESDSEMTPRKRIGAAGYAFNADLLDGLNTSAAGGSSAFVPVTDGSGHLTLTQNFILGGVMKNADGSAASPSYTFSSGDSNDGFYYYGADTIGVTVGGAAAGRLAGNFYYDTIYSNTAVTLTLKGQVADGVSAVGATIGSNNTLSTSGAKLVSFVNNTTEKAYIDKDGNLYALGANFSGLSVSSAVYTDASKNLTTTAPTSGTLGYWSRTGTTLSPATANDVVSVTGSGATAITGTSSAAGGKGIYGTATETSNTPNYGGYFTSAGGGTSYTSASAGVYGEATNTGAVYNAGGYFISAGASAGGVGVLGYATDTGAVENAGGIFIASGQSGRGVYALAYNSGAYETHGIKAQANSTGAGTSGVLGYVGGAGSDLRGVVGEAGNTGAYTNYGGYFLAKGETGRAVYGWADNSGDVENYGGYFTAEGSYGRGVYGKANSTAAQINYGGYFIAGGAGGGASGVYGEASGGVSNNYGGYFLAAGAGVSTSGVYGVVNADASWIYGVQGMASSTGLYTNYGGYFTAQGQTGVGVYGEANYTGAQTNFGGRFVAAGSGGSTAGVYGESTATGGFSPFYGGYFTAAGNYGVGVYGYATASSFASGYGVYGTSDGDTGIGVRGLASSTGGANFGGYFWSNGPGGSGVYARATGTGTTYGVHGVVNSSSGWAGYFEGGQGLYADYARINNLSTSAAVYTDASGFLTTTAPSSGALGYWDRTGATLSPYNTDDIVSVSTSTTGATAISGTTTATWGIGVSGAAQGDSVAANYGGYFTAVGTGGGTAGVYAEASGAASYVYGVQGLATGTGAFENYGGYFYAAGNSGRAVYGMANASGAVTNYGGYFEANGDSGRAVYGMANASGAVTNYGGYFQSDGNTGIAVSGWASSGNTAANYGGKFLASGTGGAYGVYGEANGLSGTNYGVYGKGTIGVYGTNGSMSGQLGNPSAGVYGTNGSTAYGQLGTANYGVYGYYDSTHYGYIGSTSYGMYGYGGTGIGTYGQATSGYGVYGEATTGAGVYGIATDNSSMNYGGQFISYGSSGLGVYASAPYTGVYGAGSGTGAVTNYGGYFEAGGDTGIAVYGTVTPSTAWAGYFTGGLGLYASKARVANLASTPNAPVYADASGNLTLTGPSSGALGYWSRTLGKLTPTTANDYVYVQSSTSPAIWGENSSAGGVGVTGTATDASSMNYGGQFISYGSSGLGVEATGPYVGVHGVGSGTGAVTNYGGYFEVAGTGDAASGVYGLAAGAGNVYGVYGQATNSGAYANRGGYFYAAGSNGAMGVFGIANNGSGVNYGVGGYSASSSTGAAGVRGQAGGGGTVYGVEGYASNSGAYKNYGGYFKSLGTGTGAAGVYGEASGAGVVVGVQGYASNTAAFPNYGGYFTSEGSSAGAAGVYGNASGNANVYGVQGEATYGDNIRSYGGYFRTYGYGNEAAGVYGEAVNANTGNSVYGVRGVASSTSAGITNYGGYFTSASGTGRGVYGESSYNSTNTQNYGGYFLAKGQQGVGIAGIADYNSTSTVNYGGAFSAAGTANGTSGVAGYAMASGSAVRNYGGQFISYGGAGYGVIGTAAYSSTATKNYGGYFTAAGTGDGTSGVYAEAAGAGLVYGVRGEASATGGTIENYGGYFIAGGGADMTAGVYGEATNTGYNATFGGRFKSSGTQPGSAGLVGETAANANAVIGVYGVASSTGAYGNYGGYFESMSTYGTGVYAYTAGASGYAAHFQGGQGLWVESGTFNQISPKLGIGSRTTAPSAVLDVYGAGGASALAIIESSSDAEASITLTTPYRVWRVGQNFSGLTDRFTIYDQTATAARFVIDTSGRIGAGGVIAPSYSFDIDNSAYARTIDATNSYSGGWAVYGEATSASTGITGVYGYANNSGAYVNYGGYFRANGTGGAYGVYGYAAGGSGANMGVYGVAGSGYGGYFTGSASYAGVYANTIKIAATGVPGQELDVEGQIQFNLDGTTDTLIGVCKNVADGAGVESNVEFRDCSGTPGDIAEWYDTTGTEPGDIVAATDDTVTFQGDMFDPLTGLPLGIQETLTATILTPSAEPYQTSLLGVISTNPIQSFGQGAIDVARLPNPMTVTGRAPTKVSTENGVIRPGDPITSSSTAGVGMKATKPGMIIGYAVDHYTGTGVGQILVNINLGWHSGFTINTDGVVSMFDDNFTFNKTGTADEVIQGYNSKGLTFRGSGWDGAAAQNVEMRLNNVVTDALNYKLSVLNNAGSEVAYIDQAGALGLSGKFYPATPTGAQTDAYIFYRNNRMRTNAAGWATGSFDFAEMFLSHELLEAGDVVILDEATNEYVKKSTAAYDNMALGIVSTEPGFLAGANVDFDDPSADQGYPIALAGRVPTKVSVENGPIRPGDFLTTSATPGVAMKATEAGLIIGTALESFDGPGVGLVKVFVNLAWYNVSGGVTPAGELAELTLTGDLNMNGHYILNVGKIVGLNDKWSIDENGILKVKLIAEDLGEKEMFGLTSDKVELTLSGSSRLEGGTKMIDLSLIDPEFIKHISAETPLKVIVTLNEPANGIYVAEKAAYSFRVAETNAGTSDAAFDWIVIARRKGYEDPPAEPAPTEPAPSEPAPTEPAPSEPAPTEPAPSEPAPTEPAPSEPAPTEPAPSEPAPTEPAPSEPAPTEPAPSEPAPTEPAPSEPAPTE